MRRAAVISMLFLTSAGVSSGRPSVAQSAGIDEKTATIEILAERFRFSPDEIRVRLGTTVQFRLESDDTDHGFHIVGTDINRIIPKRGRGAMVVPFKLERTGRYEFECSKLCGAGHEFMRGVLIVED